MADNISTLITHLILKDDFTAKAKTVKQSADDLGRTISGLQNKVASSSAGGASSTAAMVGAVGLRKLFTTPQLLGGIGAIGAFGLSNTIRNLGSGGGIFANLLSFFPRLVSSAISLASVLSLIVTKFNLVVAFGIQLLRIPFEILGTALNLVGQAVERLIGFLGGLAEKIAGVIGTIASALAGVGMSAINVSTTFDALKRTMAGFLGGRAQGEQAARYIQAYGLMSPFEQQPLFEAARVLLTVGLKLDRFLPVVERLALFAGGTSQEFREVIDLLMRAAGGQTGEVFSPRGLGRFGINRELLRSVGAKFDQQGQFIGSPREAIEVFEKLSQLPFIIQIADFMRESNVVAFSNALDALNAILVEIGDRINAVLVPAIRTVSETVIKLVRGGFVDVLIRKFSALFSPKIGEGWGTLENLVKNIAAGLLSITDVVKIIFEEVPVILRNAFEKLIIELRFMLAAVINPIIESVNLIWRALNPLMNLAEMAGIAELAKIPLIESGERGGYDTQTRKIADSWERLNESIRDVFSQNRNVIDDLISKGEKAMEGIADPSQERFASEMDVLVEATKGIERNTERLVDLQTHILGGGDIGRLGVTPIEMRNLNRSININLNASDSEYARFLLPIIRDAIVQYEKQRRLGFQR